MRAQSLKQLSAYILVSVLAVGSAFALSLRFVGSLRAQPAEEIPAQEAPADPGGSPAQEIPAAQEEPVPQEVPAAQQQPPPPAMNAPPPAAQAPVEQAPTNQAPSNQAPPIQQDPGAGNSNSGIAELEGFLEPFIYDVANRRDPFLPFAEFMPQEEGPLRALTPAQRYALEELRLVGVMWEVKDPKAMFMDPDEEVLVLGRDESIGNRNGYIAAIREGEVVVVEAIRKRGDIIYRTRVLRIER